MKRSGQRSLSALLCAAAAASVFGCSSASAQSTGRLDPRVETAYTNWRRLSQTEVDCVDQALRAQRSNLRTVIQRGIGPNDSAMAQLRTACRTQARTANQQRPNGTQALAAVGDRIDEPGSNAAERRAAERAAEQALADKVAAEIAAVKKAAAEKATAEKIAAQKASEKAESARAAADLAASRKAAEDRLVAERLAAEKAAEQADAERIAAEKATATRAAADKTAADDNARRVLAETPDTARPGAEPERPSRETVDPQSPNDRPQYEAVRIPAEAAYAYAAAQSRISFVYGLLSGPLVFCLGGVVFMLLGRRRDASTEKPAELALNGVEASASAADKTAGGDRPDLDRLVAAMMVELDRRRVRQPEPQASLRPLVMPEPVH